MNTPSILITAQAGIPVLLTSEPGMGKTAWTYGAAKALGRHCEVLIGSIKDPTDIGGMPMRVNGHCEFAPPGWFVRIRDRKDSGGSLLFIDELTGCPPAVQNTLLQLIQERRLHCGALPKDTLIIAAANPPDQAAGGNELAPPMANRLAHWQWTPSTDEWVSGMISGWSTPRAPKLPPGWDAGIPAARALVASYIRLNPAQLQAFPATEAERAGPWPSRRTWDLVAHAIAAHEAVKVAPDDAIAALVGPGAATAYCAWRRLQDLPDPEAVLASPGSHIVATRRDDWLFTVLTSVAACVVAKPDSDRWHAAWEVLRHAVTIGKADVAAVPARTLARNRPPGVRDIPRGAAAFTPVLQQAGILAR